VAATTAPMPSPTASMPRRPIAFARFMRIPLSFRLLSVC
jgi:hypothetical protein